MLATAYLRDPKRSLTALAAELGISRQAVSATLKRAEQDGLIPERPSVIKAERRARDGKAAVAALAEGATVAEAAASTGMTPKQIYRLIDVDDGARKAYESGRERAERERDGATRRIRQTIAWRGLTEAAAAQAVGLTPGALSQILTGRMALHREIVDSLATALRVPLVWLRAGERRPEGFRTT